MNFILPLFLLASLVTLAQKPDTLARQPAKTVSRSPYIFSQQELQQMVDMAGRPDVMVSNIRTFDRRYEGLRGTPFFLPYWAEGYIVLTNGQHFDRGLLKFDAFRQELILIQPPLRPDPIVIDQERVSQFVVEPGDSGEAILFRRYTNLISQDPVLSNSYFRVLYQGTHSLLQRVSKQFRAADYKDVYSTDVRYDAYTDNSVYYLLSPDYHLVKVKLAAKSLLSALVGSTPTRNPTLTDELRRQPVKTEREAVRFLEAYDRRQGAN